MKREKMIEKMIKMANNLKGNYTKENEMKIWTLCLDWNSEHPEDEIFMCEHSNDDNVVDGFYIEDDHWLYENM